MPHAGEVTATPTIRVYPADLGGCGLYRVVWPAQQLANEQVEIVWPHDPDERQIRALWHEHGDSRTLVDVQDPGADIVVIQRPLTDTLAEAVVRLQAMGVRVVVEIDDDFEAISSRNVSWRQVQPHLSPRRNREWLRLACKRADWVVCSTPALARRYGAHGRVSVVRNRVPAWYLAVESDEHEGVHVGWSGSVGTHPDDLQVTGGGVARAVQATGATFAVVGTGKGVGRRLGLRDAPLACGWVPIGEYPRAVAQLDVGIVPLEPSEFNAAKSALKMMEMAALGVPSVVSPTHENLRMAGELGQVVAESPRVWEGTLKRLVRDEDWRTDRAAAGREAMRRHTIEATAGEWLDAWRMALNTRASSFAS